MTKVLADALVPIFVGLLLGYFGGLWRRMDNQNVRTLITFVMSFAIPSALVLTGLEVSAQRFTIGGNTLIAVFLKNALQPAIALGIAMLIHLRIRGSQALA